MTQKCYTSDSTGVGSIYYSGKRSGLAFVKEDGSVQNELPLPGNVFAIANWRGNIIAFYNYAWDEDLIKDVHAILIDGNKRTIIADQLIYTNTSGNQLDCSVNVDDLGNFHSFLVRVTNRKGSGRRLFNSRDMKGLTNTTSLTAIHFSDPFQPVSQSLSSADFGAATYFRTYTNRKGEVAIISYSDGHLTAEKFGFDGHLQGRLTASLDYSTDDGDHDDAMRGRFDPANGNILTFAVANPNSSSRHRNLSSFVFDFGAGKAITLESTRLDKDYFSQFKADPNFEKAKHFKNMEYLRPDGILYLGDTLVLCNEVRYIEYSPAPNNSSHFYSEGAIMSFYDRQYHLLHRAFLDKLFGAFLDGGRGMSYGRINGKIYAFSNELTGIAQFGNSCFVIDPRAYTVEKILPDESRALQAFPTPIATLFWFRHNWLEIRDQAPLLSNHDNSYLIPAAYP